MWHKQQPTCFLPNNEWDISNLFEALSNRCKRSYNSCHTSLLLPTLWSTIIQRWSYAGQTCSLAYHVHADINYLSIHFPLTAPGPWPSRDWQFECSSKYLGIVRVSASIRQCIVDFTHPLAKCLIPQIPSFTWLWTYALVKGFLLSINLKFVPTRSPSASIASKRSQPFQILSW